MTLSMVQATAADGADLPGQIEAAFGDYIRGLGRAPQPWVAKAGVLDAGHVWRLTDADETVGAIIMKMQDKALKLDILSVFKPHRGRGHGRTALALIERHARGVSATQIELITANIYTHLVALYSSAGYRVTAIGPQSQGKDTVPRLTMVKPLLEPAP